MSILKRLHDSEINASIASFWHGCWTARLGDDQNGFTATEVCDSYEEAEAFLSRAARERFPDSLFATGHHPTGYTDTAMPGGVSADGATIWPDTDRPTTALEVETRP